MPPFRGAVVGRMERPAASGRCPAASLYSSREWESSVSAETSVHPVARLPTDWSAILSSTLIPLTVAAGFAWLAFEPADLDDWARGLLALIALEFCRPIVLSILRDTYRESHTRGASGALFNTSGERVLGAPWVQRLMWEKNRDSAVSARNEREAAERRRALLHGESG